jgi:hypothetical protein
MVVNASVATAATDRRILRELRNSAGLLLLLTVVTIAMIAAAVRGG